MSPFLHKTPPVGMSRSMRPTMLRTRQKPRLLFPFLFVIHQHSAPIQPSRERNPPAGEKKTPRFGDSFPNAIVMLSEPCHGAPADEIIIHEYGQCFYTGLKGRS